MVFKKMYLTVTLYSFILNSCCMTKTLVAGIASAVVFFLLGWLFYGILLMDYFTANSVQYAGLMKETPELWAIAIGNLCWGLAIAYILSKSGVTAAAKGFAVGFIVFLLMSAGFDFVMYGTENLYPAKIIGIDALINAVMGGISGAVAALILGRK